MANDIRPQLTIIVDTEEEFDWQSFSRNQRAVKNIQEQQRAHEIFDPLQAVPTYVIDQAVVDDDKASDTLNKLYQSGACEIGAHLHSWLTPPYEEELTPFLSYQGNLPRNLEQAKINALTRSITDRFGKQPKIFKAGRYGIGPNSYELLAKAGYEIDCSIVPHTSYKSTGGPNFLYHSPAPHQIRDHLLSIPLTRSFIGPLAFMGPYLSRMAVFDHPLAKKLKLPGILNRSGLLSRITLTPEGVPEDVQKKLLTAMYKKGTRYFSLAYHSSSLMVGGSPYSQTKEDRDVILKRLQSVLTYFKRELGGICVTPTTMHKTIKAQSPHQSKGQYHD